VRVDTEGNKVAFRDSVRWIRISSFGQYQFKTTHSQDEEWKTVILSQNEASQTDVSILQKKQHHSLNAAKIAAAQIDTTQASKAGICFCLFCSECCSTYIEFIIQWYVGMCPVQALCCHCHMFVRFGLDMSN